MSFKEMVSHLNFDFIMCMNAIKTLISQNLKTQLNKNQTRFDNSKIAFL